MTKRYLLPNYTSLNLIPRVVLCFIPLLTDFETKTGSDDLTQLPEDFETKTGSGDLTQLLKDFETKTDSGDLIQLKHVNVS